MLQLFEHMWDMCGKCVETVLTPFSKWFERMLKQIGTCARHDFGKCVEHVLKEV